MKNERRIKVDLPDADLTGDCISDDYLKIGKAIVADGRVDNMDVFIKNLEEYNRLQYRLMEKITALCKSMESMVDNDFVLINDLSPFFDEIDRITERMDDMTYLSPRDEVLHVLEDYLSLHQRLFNKPMLFVESGYEQIPKYEL